MRRLLSSRAAASRSRCPLRPRRARAGRSRPSRAAPGPRRPAVDVTYVALGARGPDRDRERAPRRRRGRALHEPARQPRRPRRGVGRLGHRAIGRRAHARALRRRRALPDRAHPPRRARRPAPAHPGAHRPARLVQRRRGLHPSGRWLYLIPYPSSATPSATRSAPTTWHPALLRRWWTRASPTSDAGPAGDPPHHRDGRWAYTLYKRPRGAFVHALDTARPRRRASTCRVLTGDDLSGEHLAGCATAACDAGPRAQRRRETKALIDTRTFAVRSAAGARARRRLAAVHSDGRRRRRSRPRWPLAVARRCPAGRDRVRSRGAAGDRGTADGGPGA